MRSFKQATCIGCGCDDRHACVVANQPCSWLRVDRVAGVGVCSECVGDVARWDNGYREPLVEKEDRA